MKIRKDFLLALFILFAIPVIGYFVLQRAADDRNKITARLQPKDSIPLDFQLAYLDAEGVKQMNTLIHMPYVLKVIATEEGVLNIDQLKHIIYIINDREDLAFLIHEASLQHTVKERIIGYHYVNEEGDLKSYGDILLVDAFNRIVQVYDRSDPQIYKKLLEDISYAFPMVDFQIDKRSEHAKPE